MKGYAINVLLAFSAGLLGVMQGAINAYVGKSQGQYGMIIGVSAAQIIVAALILWRMKPVPLHASFIPWMLAAGFLGVGIMFGVSFATGSIGALPVFIAIMAGQIIASAIMDHFGLLGLARSPFTVQKLGSILLILLGVLWLMKSSK